MSQSFGFRRMPRRLWRRFIWTERGQSAVEFALVMMLVALPLFFATVDFSRIFFVRQVLQGAMRAGARFAVTGNNIPDPLNPGNMLSRVDSIIATTRNAAIGLTISDISISSVQGGSSGDGRAGGPGDVVTISVTTNLKLLTPLIGRYFGSGNTARFTVQATFRNEPFPPAQTK